jgi:hypothetical protein
MGTVPIGVGMDRYKLRDFTKWAKSVGLSDKALHDALDEMNRGLRGNRLGAGIFKKRIGLPGRGKRGGVRTIVFFKQHDFAVFIYGYAKNEKADLDPRELAYPSGWTELKAVHLFHWSR